MAPPFYWHLSQVRICPLPPLPAAAGLAMSTAEYPRLATVRQSIGRLVTDAVRAEIVASTTAVHCYIDGVTSEEPVHASTLVATLNFTSRPGLQYVSCDTVIQCQHYCLIGCSIDMYVEHPDSKIVGSPRVHAV